MVPRSSRAHPRSRGENDDLFSLVIGDRGSSPLTRGKRSGSGLRGWSVGLIPAHAGKTEEQLFEYLDTAAHPRSRGENPFSPRIANVRAGSSPLTRGKPGRKHLQRD